MGNDFNRDEELERIINSDDESGLMVWINKNVSINVGQRLDDKLFTLFLFNVGSDIDGARPMYEA